MRNVTTNGRAKKAAHTHGLADDIAAVKRDVRNLVGTGTEAVVGRARGAAARVGEEGRSMADEARKRLDTAHTAIANRASQKPLTTIALSMAAGAVVAQMLSWAVRRS